MSHKIVLGSEIAIKSSFNKIRRQRATLTGAASQGRNIRLTTDNGDNINVIVVHWNQFVLFTKVCLDKKLFIFVPRQPHKPQTERRTLSSHHPNDDL